MIMCADVLEVNENSLLVRDNATSQEVIVNKPCVCKFHVNDRVGIVYNGIMTRSIPPQINASRIFRMPFNRCF
ncbi:hypothetical protein [Porcipelethomonas sp.]|uniref:hypothetical protein n=1 Tax=Porcipelethomonas sp. TaxID=2981675 RepID=UPI003079EA65